MSDLFQGWAVVELFGHRRIAGRVCEVEHFGTKMCRIDVPKEPLVEGEPEFSTQLYGGQAIYCVTPTTERLARLFASRFQPTPVFEWELPTPRPTLPSAPDEARREEPDEVLQERDEVPAPQTIDDEASSPSW